MSLGPKPEEPSHLRGRETYPPDIHDRMAAEAREIIARYPVARSALLPLLHLVQAEDGCLTPAGVEFCSEQLDLTGAEVTAVATFYSMYRRDPTGDYLVGVCANTLCAVMGGDAVFDALRAHLDIGNDQTTDDGKITLQHIECNAACDYAPVVMVNWESSTTRPRSRQSNSSRRCAPGNPWPPPVACRCARSAKPRACWRVSPTTGQMTARAEQVQPRWPACG